MSDARSKGRASLIFFIFTNIFYYGGITMTNNLTYTLCGDYCIPNLSLSATEAKSLGKYGRMRKTYLKEHRPILWNTMIL